MENERPSPPGYTSTDTSNKQAKKIPYFFLGPPHQMLEGKTLVRSTQFREKDLSGNYLVKRLRDQAITIPHID
jgi:hypothetical protein